MTWGPTFNFGGFKMLTWRGMTTSRAAVYGFTPPQNPPQDFPLFSNLPAELRLKIWNFAIDDIPKQVLSIQPKQSSIPSLLQACSESRYESQRTYTKRSTHAAIFGCTYYINHKKDTLYLDNSLGLGATATMHHHTLRPIRHLAISFKQLAHLTSFFISQRELDLWNLLQQYTPELKTLYIVVGTQVKGKKADLVEISGEEAYMDFCNREERRQLIEASKSFELAQSDELWKGLELRLCRERAEGEGVGVKKFRIGAWGATDWKF